MIPSLTFKRKSTVLMPRERLRMPTERSIIVLIGEVSPEKFLGYFPLASIMNNLDVREHFDYLQSNRHFHFNVYDLFTSLVYARTCRSFIKHRTFHDVMPSMFSAPQDSYYQLLDAVEFLGEEYQKNR